MKRAPPLPARGATRLELVLAAILAATLAGVLLNSIIRARYETEQVAVKQLIGSLRTALAVRSAKVISTTGDAGLIALAHQNPMSWLRNPPKNYLGEYYSPHKSTLPAGHWYFDRVGPTLVYLPSSKKSFSPGIQKILVFKVKLLRVSGSAKASGREKGSAGLVIDQVNDQAVAINTRAESVSRPYPSEKK